MTETATLQQALARFFNPAGLDRQRQRVCRHLLACRTEAMGGTVLQCTDCDHTPGKMHEKPLYDGLRSALPVGANVVT
ncbi:hypothetical protein HIR79_07420 [Halomonas sp. PGE1]|nr:hypothetical protein HIR79_07420 [Halomonas sp. PGE1]